MKVLFLSVDGILNSHPLSYHYGYDYIDKDMLNLLVEIIASTKIELVLNLRPELTSVRRRLADLNIETQDCQGRAGIEDWLRNHTVENYAILSDEIDYKDSNQFRTDPDVGLTEEMAKKIIRHLRKKK